MAALWILSGSRLAPAWPMNRGIPALVPHSIAP